MYTNIMSNDIIETKKPEAHELTILPLVNDMAGIARIAQNLLRIYKPTTDYDNYIYVLMKSHVDAFNFAVATNVVEVEKHLMEKKKTVESEESTDETTEESKDE